MALVRFGPMTTAASGRLGSTCFSRQGGSPIIRSNPLPRRSDSQLRLATKALFSHGRAAWRALSEAERLPWHTAATQFPTSNRLGLSRQLSPFALFMQCALRNLFQGDAVPSAPSPTGNIDIATPLSISLFPNGPAQIAFSGYYNYAFPNVTILAQRLCRTHPDLPGQLWRAIVHQRMQDQGINFWPALCAAFGTPQPLEWYRFELTQWIPAWPRKFVTRSLVQIPNVGPELIHNGTFTTGGTPPQGWNIMGPGSLTQDDYFPYSDGFSAYWEHGVYDPQASFYSWVPYLFSLTAGKSYTLRLAKKIEAFDISKITIEGTGMATVTLYGGGGAAFTPWTLYEYPWTQLTNATNCYVRFYSYANTPAEVLFDNISIRKDTP